MALNWFLSSAYAIVLGQSGGKEIQKIDKSLERKKKKMEAWREGFQMPLHYPRYKKEDYEKMEEWKLDMLLREYGLSFKGTLEEKRRFAMGAFLWPDQLES